jgi:hypothetical protein
MASTTTVESLKTKQSRFASTHLLADLSGLSRRERKALEHCVKAAEVVNELYFLQVYQGNRALRKALSAPRTELQTLQRDYFEFRKGPWCPLDETPFIDGVPHEQPAGAALYPEDLSAEEFTQWVDSLPEDQKVKAQSYFTAIRRDKKGKLKVVPYSREYSSLLKRAAAHLRRAAMMSEDPSLKKFASMRAHALLSNDYQDSDVAWLGLNGLIELVIGPYETYEDTLFGFKAFFEAYVTIANQAESQNLQRYAAHLQSLEDNLPIEARFRSPKLAGSSPMRVADLVYASGEAMSGVMTAAFNLPNDEDTRAKHGTKQVLLKNVQQAKFDQVLMPIANRILPGHLMKYVSFEAFFTHILWHELLHGLGPHDIVVNGKASTVRLALLTDHSAIEEAKADATALWAMHRLINEGVLDKTLLEAMYVTYLASAFRSIRFGLEEAHGKGQALQFNFLVEKGAFKIANGQVDLDFDRLQDAVAELCGVIMTIQAAGDAAGGRALLERYAKITPEMAEVLAKLEDVPVDIKPSFEHY